MRRIGVFGGTFDPPHLGHLVLAERARDQLGLDRVVFVPAGTPPHKVGRTLSGATARVAMTRLAVRGNRAFTVSTFETRRVGPSFTVDTLRAMRAAWKGARLFLLLGGDSLREFDTWHEPEAILRLATLAVASRPGRVAERATRAARRCAPHSILEIEGDPLAISSTELRARARQGRSIRYLVPEAVAAYVRRHRLYGGTT